ncbi:response regulator [Paramicrobacterium chengjingii]|uniref:Response regulator transcription factor n=1 Tax=Paramicrobacterium chengjingii TaxID=2769067 RepID=A0ABX6YG41_9MICO|nr:response regulator transcription factor [Microbacterium chengjingii]QPZ37768.1 response regulator transcription factor [Microbacterium chengjingii]
MSIRLALVDDEPLVRAGLRAILDAEPGLSVVCEGSDGEDVLNLVDEFTPDLLVMDVRMPRVSGIEATRLLRQRPDSPRVLILTTFDSDDHVYEALKAGADGFVVKRAEPAELVRAVRIVAEGDSLLYPARIRRLATRQSSRGDKLATAHLSEREKDVLRGVARGLSNAQIASELFVGAETVKSHVASILMKLAARDRTQAVIAAYESGFIEPGAALPRNETR